MTEVKLGKELEQGIVNGVRKLKESVSSTLGPYGRTVLTRNKDGKLVPTKDGVTVAKQFNELEDPVENAGAQMVKEVAIKSADEAGDGTTTSTLLAAEIIETGFKLMENGSNSVQIKKGIDLAVKEVIEGLKEISVDITEDSQIKEVATISGNNDEEIGNLIATALDKVGRDGVVSIEKSKDGETSLEIAEGIQFERGYKSPYFVTDNNKMNVILEKPLILLFDGRITKGAELLPSMQLASSTDTKSLLIIADDIEGEALATLIVNKQRGIVNSVAVKAPDFGDRKKQILEDLAVITGATLLSIDKGNRLDKMTEMQLKEFLGSSRTVTVDKETTTIVDGKCSEDSIKRRLEEIKNQIELSKSPFEKERLQDRLGRIAGGVAIISVGGNSDVEIEEKRDRVEDALFAAKASLEEGIVPGGGIALLRARNNIKFDGVNKDIDLGKKIIYDACSSPFIKILLNAGWDLVDTIMLSKEIEKMEEKWLGYDLKISNITNMADAGIIDPLKVVRKALENSSSVAGTLLTTNSFVFEKKEDKPQSGMDMMF